MEYFRVILNFLFLNTYQKIIDHSLHSIAFLINPNQKFLLFLYCINIEN